MLLAPNARFCSYCGSNSLILVVTELKELASKESLGIYVPLDVSKVSTEDLVPKRSEAAKERPHRHEVLDL